jgi:signal transduction histidine kinase
MQSSGPRLLVASAPRPDRPTNERERKRQRDPIGGHRDPWLRRRWNPFNGCGTTPGHATDIGAGADFRCFTRGLKITGRRPLVRSRARLRVCSGQKMNAARQECAPGVAARARELFERELVRVHARRDRVFGWLLLGQWLFAVAIAAWWSPFGWESKVRAAHSHVHYALLVGAVLSVPPWLLTRMRPGAAFTRHVIAGAQMLFSALLSHLSGGRIETQFHVFGSLAFLAFYRDWYVLVTATAVFTADHLMRGSLWPESVYGITNPEWWRYLEHAFWVFFENCVLVAAIIEGRAQMREIAQREAELEQANASVEETVRRRTLELELSREQFRALAETTHAVERELAQAQKLEAVGRLASGVAHEINTPVQFVSDSIHFVRDAVGDFVELTEKYRGLRAAALEGKFIAEALRVVEEAETAADLPYLIEQVPKALARALEGLDRVATIVRSMKEFAHPDQKEMAAADLNQAIESTLVIARNEYKYVADLVLELGELPPVRCFVGDLNQVVLNVIVNAAHAIGDVVKDSGTRGQLGVRTQKEGQSVIIEISDTGTGIPEANRAHVFDPFFTTKEVGKGTGQGLAIARSVVCDKHGGELTFETTSGKGTVFRIRLPIDGKSATKEAA